MTETFTHERFYAIYPKLPHDNKCNAKLRPLFFTRRTNIDCGFYRVRIDSGNTNGREQNARTFGVLQNRRRMIIVGWLKQSGLKYPDFLEIKTDAIVNDLLADLPKLHPGESSDKYARTKASSYVIGSGIRAKDDVLTLHNSRPNIERDINIYRRAIELWNDGHKRLNYNDLPDELKTHKNRHSFTDRFKVVEGDESYCHTILAHLSKDGHYFIHPDLEQNRSITVREAARIQSFPDSYYFKFVQQPKTALLRGRYLIIFAKVIYCRNLTHSFIRSVREVFSFHTGF